MSDIVEKKSAFVSYDGNDEKIKMISDAVNNLTEDVRHDSVTFDNFPDIYRNGDINFKCEELGFGDPFLQYNKLLEYSKDEYEEYFNKPFPVDIDKHGYDISIYQVDGLRSADPEWYTAKGSHPRSAVSIPVYGLKPGSKYSISFQIESYVNTINKCLRLNPEEDHQNALFGIVIHNYPHPDRDDSEPGIMRNFYPAAVSSPYYYYQNTYGVYYPEVQYYSFPKSVVGASIASFDFIAFEHTTYITFLLDNFLTTEELIQEYGQNWYDAYVKDRCVLFLRNFKISNYDSYYYSEKISSLYSFNNDIWAYYGGSEYSRYGLAVPESSEGNNGDYYVQHSLSSKTDTCNVIYSSSYNFVNDIVRKDSSGYYLESHYEEEYSPSFILYKITNLEAGKVYKIVCDIESTEEDKYTHEAVPERYIYPLCAIGPTDSFINSQSSHVEKTIMSIDGTICVRVYKNQEYSHLSRTILTSKLLNLQVYEYSIQDIWYKVEGAWYKYEPQGGGGGTANVSITPTLLAGTQIASFSIEDQSGTTTGELYAPTPIQPTEVEANPSGTATDTLTKLDVGGTIYSISSGGGGSSVTPNPQGDATAALSKLQVENDIYSIPVVSTDTSLPVSSKENDIFFKALEVGVIEHVPSTSQQKTGDASIDHEVVDTSTNSKSVYGQLWDEFDDFIVYSTSGLMVGESYTLTFSFVQDGNDIRHNTNMRNCFAVVDRIIYPSTDYGMSGSRDGGTVETLSVGGVTIGKSIIMYYDKTLHSYTLPFTALASTMYVICSPQEWKNGTSYGGVVRNYEWTDINISGYSYDNNELYFKKGNSFHKLTIPKTTTVSITPELGAGTKIAEYEIDGVTGELYAPGGSNESVIRKTILYNTPTTSVNTEITLSDDITKYDELEFILGFNTTDKSQASFYYSVSDFIREFPYTGSTASTNPQFIATVYSTYFICFQCGSSNNKIYIVRSDRCRLCAINGIKYTIECEGEETDLYNSGSDTAYAAYDTIISLSDSISNYDQLRILISTEGEGGLAGYVIDYYVDTDDALSYPVGWHGYFKRYLKATFTATSFTYTGAATDENADRTPRIYKIIGIKHAGKNNTLIGTSDPDNNTGNNGDLYLKDTSFGISKIFAKINGTWKIYNPFIEYEWDFTSSVTSNNGTMITLNGATRSSSGITIAGASQYASIPPTLLRLGYTYEIHISSMSITSSSLNNRLFTYTTSEALNAGLVYRGQSGKWAVWDNTNLWQESTINSKDYFNNSVLKIVIDASGKWHIYKDNVVVFEPTNALPMVNTAFALGSSSYSANSTTISAFKIYPNVE